MPLNRWSNGNSSSVYTGPTASAVIAGGAIYQVSVTGGGYSKVHSLGHGVIGLQLLATTPNSTLSITLERPRPHTRTLANLQVGQIYVNTGQLGTINAPAADLVGTMTPLNNPVTSIEFADLGPTARIDVNGALNGLTIPGNADIGPTGHVYVGGNLTGPARSAT